MRENIPWLLFVVACGGKDPPPSSPVRPAPVASVAPMPESSGDVHEEEPQAPSRSLYTTGPRTIGGGAATAERPRWHGAPIDLDVKGADLHEVCRLIADVGKVNIVVSDEVKGAVTIKMKGVPWDQALDTILRAKGYRTEKDGSVILVVK